MLESLPGGQDLHFSRSLGLLNYNARAFLDTRQLAG